MYGNTAKFKSVNIFISAARDQTAKFNKCQYFRLYDKLKANSTLASYPDPPSTLQEERGVW